ncbi:uncharacterized protein LOC122075331 [Macadamia integrifolia]|uniref:uncharacterized protein LOC122075331 n=1 Tax=Macadamia integrifolia TaxID=60698 RepID=UPI001C4F72A0|nr:uncharacterized protein LOC122075331 [Macadamia integrifolia]
MSSSARKSSENEIPVTSESPETSDHPSPSEIQTIREVSDLSVGDKGQDSGVSDQLNVSGSEEGEGGEDEEEGECGFCLFMKGGGCRDSFISWEKCVEDAEKNKEDVVEKCSAITGILHKCMEAHADYYEPILRAEKAAEEEVVKELEREAASKESNRETESKDKQEA